MVRSSALQLPLWLLYAGLATSTPIAGKALSKRADNYDVLHGVNFPDPGIINVGGTSYVFGTVDGRGNNVPMTSNSNFNNAGGWSNTIDAFPQNNVPAVGNGGWGKPFTTWAPDVNQLTDGDGSFAMYYAAALQSNPGVHCLGVARSLHIQGPYNDSSSQPWICPESDGGAIDAAGFLDDNNSRYVAYKIDGPAATNGGYCNSPNNPYSYNTSIMLQQTTNDGYTKVGTPVVLYNNAGVSDKYNIEAPAIVKNGGWYFLFFSSGCTSDNSYTTSYVTSQSIWGPYSQRTVLIKTGDYGQYAPGGMDITLSGGQAVYHSLSASNDISKPRVLDTATLSFNGQTVTIQ